MSLMTSATIFSLILLRALRVADEQRHVAEVVDRVAFRA